MMTSTFLRFTSVLLVAGAMTACQPSEPTADTPAEPATAAGSATTDEATEPTSMDHGNHASSGHAAAMEEASGDMAGMDHGDMAGTDHGDMAGMDHGDMEHAEHGGMDMPELGEYDSADWSNQPGAELGDVTRCPVSGEEFRVSEDSPFFEHNGEKVYFCCPGCIRQFQRNPDALLAAAFPGDGSAVVDGATE